jgi:hypothetical protein
VGAVIARLRVAAPADVESADAVFVQAPPVSTGEGWRLLGLAGLELWPRTHRRSLPEGDIRMKRKVGRRY